MTVRGVVAVVFGLATLSRLAASENSRASELPLTSSVARLPVTNGLIHWWPNLFDARDEVTGQEGVIMGILPPIAPGSRDETEFDHLSGWVQLRPALTNRSFTVAFWMRWRLAHHSENIVVLAQENADAHWRLAHRWHEGLPFHLAIHSGREPEQTVHFDVAPDQWHHLVLAFEGVARRLVCSVDARRVFDEPLTVEPPFSSPWLTVGNQLKGDSQWGGALRDLCVFDRVLSDPEVRALQDAGLPERPARLTEARRTATAPSVPIRWQTNVTDIPETEFTHRRYTTEDGLPDNIVQAILQARNGYLWVGTERGLARFDGRNFRAFTAENTPALAAIGSDISSLAEDADGTLWAGAYGGLLRIRAAQRFASAAYDATKRVPSRRPPGLVEKRIGQNGSSRPGSLDRSSRRDSVPTSGSSRLTSAAAGVMESDTGRSAVRSVVAGLEFTAFTNGLPERFVLQAAPAGDGSVWVAAYRVQSPRGACRLRRYHPETETSSAEIIVPGRVGRLVAATNGVWIATDQPAALLFWDGQAAASLMLAKLNERPAGWRLRDGAPLTAESQVRGWTNPEAALENWVEIKCAETGPVFGWHWRPGSFHATLTRWCGERDRDDWLAGEGGLNRVRESRIERLEFRNRPTPPNVACACANHEGGVWFGTEEDGLHFVQERLVRVFTTRDGLIDDAIRSVCVLRDGTVVAGSDGGVNEWRGEQWSQNRQFEHVAAVNADADGRVWLAVEAIGPDGVKCLSFGGLPGLNWSDPNSLRFAADRTLWVVCALGVTWIKSPATAPETFLGNGWTNRVQFGRFRVGKELPDSPPVGLVEGRDGSIWAGTMGGGLLRLQDGRATVFTKRDGLPGDFCAPAYRDRSGALWILTEAGLARRKDDRFQVVCTADGLPNDLFSDLVEDDFGHFWLPGKRGIHRLERSELEALLDGRLDRLHSLTLGVRDGLLTPECSSQHYPCAAKTPDGRIWVPTREGIAVIDPRRVELDTQPLPVFVEDLFVNKQSIEHASHGRLGTGEADALATASPLRLKPGSGKHVEIHYSALSLTAADRVRFRYRLDGCDREWSQETDLRLAFYTNLRPGQYRFRVKAANSHGIWNEDEVTLDFSIAPYLWERPVFWATLGLLVVVAAGLLHRHRMGVLQRLEELKHRTDLATERERIAADMHDQLGSALTQITMLGEGAKNGLDDASQTRRSLERITQAARDVTGNISDLVWATNPRYDTLEELAAHVREHAAQQLDDAGIKARLDFLEGPPAWHVSATFRRNVLLVVKEAIHNTVKHAGATEVRVRMAVENNGLTMRIEDNGCGFEVLAPIGRGNGLPNMPRRVHELGGEFELRSSPGQGARIEVRIPVPSPSSRLPAK